jgi:glycosyltransferase involved in cell wall biosynthesis
MSASLISPQQLDAAGVPVTVDPDKDQPIYHPTIVAHYALAAWNTYISTGSVKHKQVFTTQLAWLRAHEVRLNTGASVWLIPLSMQSSQTSRITISAHTQGTIISVFMRAYQLTTDEAFLHIARRAVQPFLGDILDGGVSAPIGDDGIFFEDAAMYPAANVLRGHLFALMGLKDYVTLINDPEVLSVMCRGHNTLHSLFQEYDTKVWSRVDLLYKNIASPATHALHTELLEALSHVLLCDQCAAQARQWVAKRRRLGSRLGYSVLQWNAYFRNAFERSVRRALFGKLSPDAPMPHDLVCVPITAFPVAGGMRSVLAGVTSAMRGEWEMEYLTHTVGTNAEGMTIHAFGTARAMPWQFPNVWLYASSGGRKLFQLLRQGHKYRLIIPQDGTFTGAFSAVVARLAGVRVLCMDHGNVTLPHSPIYQAERKRWRMAKPWPRRLLFHLRDACYSPSLRLLARISIRYTDTFLPAGDDVADAYVYHYGVHPSRIMRYPFMIDADRFTPRDEAARAELRTQLGISSEAIVIAMVNRLAPEKGLDVAIEGLSQALSALPVEVRARVRLIIAGDGALRDQIEADIRHHDLEAVCKLWGEAMRDEVGDLLGISDIFLHTGNRGINPVALLEAMAAGCATISTTAPKAVARYLDENRGIAVPVGDVDAIAGALVRTITDLQLCRNMGRLAREYITVHHTATALRRSLLRAAFWVPDIAQLRDASPNAMV